MVMFVVELYIVKVWMIFWFSWDFKFWFLDIVIDYRRYSLVERLLWFEVIGLNFGENLFNFYKCN